MNYEETKEILERDYADYFKILNLDMQIRVLMHLPKEQWQEILLKNLKNYMECEKITASQTAYEFHNWYKWNYERKLEIFNKIMEGVK